jgi:hypothetical protein
VIGLQLVAIGWLVTSGEARRYLHQHATIRRVMLWSIVVLLLLDLGSQLAAWNLSRAKLALLVDIGYMDEKYFRQDGISPLYLGVNAGVHVLLAIFLGALVASTARAP